MKKFLITTLATGFMLVGPVATAAESMGMGPQHEKALNYFKSGEEVKVKDAVWTSPTIFKVGVFDDKTNRNGYAEYVCMVLGDYGFQGKNIWVQIIDYEKLVKTGSWKKLGESYCS